jgi:quercetin dioxygenase-like cupin family protein
MILIPMIHRAMIRTLLAATLFVSLSAVAQQKDPVEITSEPSHHLVMENLFVRVFAVTINPKATTLMHRHGKDYVTVALGDSEIQNTKQGAQAVDVKFKDGQVGYAPAGLVHEVADAGDRPFRNLTIELMQPTTNQKACTENCSIPIPCDSADKTKCVTETKVMGSDQWSVTQIVIPAGATYPKHTHLANFLVIPLVDGDIKARSQDGPENTMHNEAGKPTWNNPVVHTLTNAGTTPVKAVVLEFRGRPAGEGSESMGNPDKPAEHKPHDHH